MRFSLKYLRVLPIDFSWRGLARISLIATFVSPLTLAGVAASADAASSPPYLGPYTGTSICTTNGAASVGPQIVINGVDTNIYECGKGSSLSTANTPFDQNGGGGGYDSTSGSFQCVELSMRFEYIAYAIGAPWKGGPNGENVVSYLHAHYQVPVAFGDGSVAPPSPNIPAPVAGDVLSLGPANHTAVIENVTGSPTTGNYSVTIISQNAPTIATITVKDWIWPDLWGNTEYNWTLQGVQGSMTLTSPPINAVVGPNETGGNSSGVVEKSSMTVTSTAQPTLTVGQQLTSANGGYSLVMQGDGNLVEYNSASKALWWTSTTGTANTAVLQSDGNFVVYPSNGTTAWSSKTGGAPGSGVGDTLVVQDDGNVVLYPPSGPALWSTGTSGYGAYNAAPLVQQSLYVGRGKPTTPVISNLLKSGTYGDHFTAAVSTTGDGITSVTSTTTGVCTTSGLVVSFVGVGTCSLTAHVATGTNYTSADGSAQTFAISRAAKALPAKPATITATFVAKSSVLSPAAKKSLATLAKKLVLGASLTFTGYAKGNAGLAQSRARNVASYLSSKVSIHVTLKEVTSLRVNKVTVATTKQ